MSSLPLFQSRNDAAGERLWTVSELTGQIKATLETDFANIGLRGEVSGLSRPRSGHVYFNLKDDSASIRAVLWKSAASRLVFELTDGLAVRAWGDLTVYAPRGEYQITVRKIEPEGIGALELAFRQTIARLAAEGLFDPDRKRPLPRFPRRIVIVTSPTGAAIRDLLQVITRRWSAVELLIAPVKVQGQGAAEEIAAGIAIANQVPNADLIILTRGGGSLEDLWAFNEEIVARAIYGSRLPVVSAVGHEIDVTIADYVADFRALTPSEAGERCVPDAAEILARLDHVADRLTRLVRAEFQQAHVQFERLEQRLSRAGQDQIRDARATLDLLAGRAAVAWQTGLERRRHTLGRAAAQLDALSPLGVLARGYSLTLQDDGTTVVRSSEDCRPGDRIRTRLGAGTLISRVEEIA
jgi:exodeoxyribonuclease VII large subunit